MSCSANYRLSSLVAEPLHARDEIHVSAAQLWLTPCCVPTALKRFKENLKNDNHKCSQPTSYAVLLDSLCVRGCLPQPTTVNVRLTFSATTLHQCSNVGTKCQCQKYNAFCNTCWVTCALHWPWVAPVLTSSCTVARMVRSASVLFMNASVLNENDMENQKMRLSASLTRAVDSTPEHGLLQKAWWKQD